MRVQERIEQQQRVATPNTQQQYYETIIWATGGHHSAAAAAAGHDNLFNQSYTAAMERSVSSTLMSYRGTYGMVDGKMEGCWSNNNV